MQTAKNETDWAQKYRPQRLEDMVLPARIKDRLINLRDTKQGLNLLLHGEAGTGKTTAANLINPENTYTINCSADNGIDKVRQIAVQFTSHSVIADDRPRVILLDEADYLTEKAQAGLRGTIEDLSRANMFVFTANFPEKIIQPLHSRLFSIDFSLIRGDQKLQREMLDRVYEILNHEGVPDADESTVKEIVKQKFPDMRNMLKVLQFEIGLRMRS